MITVQTRPHVEVEVDGLALSPEDASTLATVRVQQRLSLPTLCELVFLDPGGDLADASLQPGPSLRVAVPGESEPLFIGDVTAVEYAYGSSQGLEVRIRGYDALHRLRKRQPLRAHVQVTLEDLAGELAADVGLSVDASESGPVLQNLIQYRQSDFELLAEVAGRCGLHFTARNDTLHVFSLEGIGQPLPLVLGESLLEACLEINGEPATRSVAAFGWDPLRVERHDGRSDRTRLGRDVAADADPDRLGGTGERTLADVAVRDDQQAEALAQGELDSRTAAEVVLTGVADGDPRLQPGTPVVVEGVGAPISGRFALTEVDHTIDSRSGYVSRISSGPPPPQPRPWGTVMTYGVVASVDDPDALGRVKVTLPTYGDVETDWMGVVTAGAGSGKGLVALPDVDDQVLVLFAREDPTKGVVIGGLYGAEAPPDAGVEGGAVRRYTFRTPGGQQVQLDDERETIRLENSNGSFIELSPEKATLHSAVRLEIEAPGKPIVIRGRSIDFESA